MHKVPNLLWSIMATDLFEWHGEQYSILVDSYSGWYEIDKLTNTTSAKVIKTLKNPFAVHGAQSRLYTDNAQQYTCAGFDNFTVSWDF